MLLNNKTVLFSFLKTFIHNKETNNAAWLISGRVIQLILSFLISIFTARYLGPQRFGLISYGGAYVAFFMSLCTLGINSIIVKEMIECPNEEGTLLGTTLVLRGISSLFSSLFIIGIVFFLKTNEPQTITVTALCSFSLFFHIFDTFSYWFQAKYQSKITAISFFIAYLATTIYKVYLLVAGKSVVWFAFATSVDYLFVALCLYIAYKRHNGPHLHFSWNKGQLLLQRSYHYIVSGLMVSIYGQTDKIMLEQLSGKESVAYYSLAYSVNLMWVFVLQAIIDSLYPTIMHLFMEGTVQDFERKNRQLYSLVIYISLFVGILFFFFGKFAIVRIYGVEYEKSGSVLRIITWYTIFAYLGVARNAWIVCKNQQNKLKYIYCCAAIINIFLNYILIPPYNAAGAALASLLTQVGTCMIIPLLFRDMRRNVYLMIDALLLRGLKKTNLSHNF